MPIKFVVLAVPVRTDTEMALQARLTMWTKVVSVKAEHYIILKRYFPYIHPRIGIVWGGGNKKGKIPHPQFFYIRINLTTELKRQIEAIGMRIEDRVCVYIYRV